MFLFVSAEGGREPVAPRVTVFPPSELECKNEKDSERKKTLVCLATEFYPDHVTVSWEVDGNKVTAGVATDSSAIEEKRKSGNQEIKKYYKITSRLRVPAKDWFTDGNEFKCIVTFFNGTAHENVTAVVYGEKRKFTGGLKNTSHLMFQLEITVCSCSLLLSYNRREDPGQR